VALKILIEGNINKKDAKALHIQLNSHASHSYIEIEFKETQYLPYIIVKDLFALKDKLEISTSKKSLYIYLSKLGITNTYKYREDFNNTHYIQDVKALAIGGSAGSVSGVIELIKTLPYVDISVFITLHILPNKESLLSKILSALSSYNVVDVSHKLEIKKRTIYIAPPNKHLTIKNNCIYLSEQEAVNYARPSISVMFDSLANAYKNSLLAILLCGYGKDAACSIPHLKENKCEVIFQNPKECEAKDMLNNAIKQSHDPHILNLKNIQNYLDLKLSPLINQESDIRVFLQDIYDVYGYDYRNYELKSLKRRIEFVRLQVHANDFSHFKQMVLNHKNIFYELRSAFSVNLTEFFRNAEVFKKIQSDILPTLASLKYLRIWCAGCSSGDEPYSLAILLQQAGLLEKTQIYATDINETILNEAINGIYALDLFSTFQDNYKKLSLNNDFKDYFTFHDKHFEVNKEIKEKVLFFKHNLVSDASINEFNLILCRNVLIYFDKDLKQKVFNIMNESLSKDGFLVLGESEALAKNLNYQRLGNKKIKIYKKTM